MDSSRWFTPAVVALVLVVGGLALADSVRGCDTTTTTVAPAPSTTEEAPPETTTEEGPQPQEEAPADWPQGELHGVLTFVDTDECLIRTIGLAGGRERPVTRFKTDCRGFWAPRVGARVAFGEVLSEGFFRVADLRHPRRDFGSFPIGAHTMPIWSPDGQRIAWCESPNSGVELEILGRGRLLPFCPAAYLPDGDLAHIEGLRLVGGGETLAQAPKPIQYASVGDGWVGLVLDGFDLVRYEDGEQVARTGPQQGLISGPPMFSPDGCVVAVPLFQHVGLVRLCRGDVTYDEVPGTEASFSPDGSRLAVNGLEGITFYSGLEAAPEVEAVWPVRVAQLAWRAD